MAIYQLTEDPYLFPDPKLASSAGLLAIGGDLTPERLITAYSLSFFPWYNPGEEILWWTPDPRLVLFPKDLKVSKSMRPYFNQNKFQITFNQNFEEVIRNCQSNDRKGQTAGSWITNDITAAYTRLHDLGYVHSVEVWQDEELVGGLYGIALGKVFFGESMFAKVSNASKFGFISLVQKLQTMNFTLIDCQQETNHLKSMGAAPISRDKFMTILEKNSFDRIEL